MNFETLASSEPRSYYQVCWSGMGTAHGPRYAPFDPTLPEPWKELNDGSTSSMYYWNPITQYEKPASHMIQSQRPSSSYHPQTHVAQHLGPTTQPPWQVRPHVIQQPSQWSQLPMPLGQQGSMHQAPYQQIHVTPGAQMRAQHGFQFPSQHTQYMVHQQNIPPSQQLPHIQGYKMDHGQEQQPGSSQANQNLMQGQQYPHPHEHKSGIAQRDNVEFQQGNQPPWEMRIGDFPSQNPMPSLPGRLNSPGGSALPVVCGNSSGASSYPNNAFVRPPLTVMESLDPMHLSAAEMHEVTVTGENVPAPFMAFESTGFPPEMLHELHVAGFSAPTPIQAQTWPVALQNRDMVAIAKTCSGKTLSYMMPAFIHLSRRRNNPQHGLTVLVLAPTRELATQIQDEAIKFGQSSGVSCTCLYGGVPKAPQIKELKRGADILVATPGRLNDILDIMKVDFRQVSLLVLDEADGMLDMGFGPQIRKIVNEILPRRQTLMYTTTWPEEVRKIATDLLMNPVQVNIGSGDLYVNKSITQYVEVLHGFGKKICLEEILRSQGRGSKIIIFCSTKKLCDHVERWLEQLVLGDIRVAAFLNGAAIHGGKSQAERDLVLNKFRCGKSNVLITTDISARVHDIRDIRVVINYDFPTEIEDYVLRIGRAAATGLVYTLFSEGDWKYAPDLVKVLEAANQVVSPEVRDTVL